MKKVTATIETITPEKARDWFNNHLYERQRTLRPKWVDELAREMKNQRFRQGTEITICFLGDREILTNGQHTLRAIYQSGLSQALTVIRHTVDNEEELNHVYVKEDRHKGRSFNDVSKALSLPAKYSLTQTQVTGMARAVKFILSDFTGSPRMDLSDEELVENLDKYAEDTRMFFAITRGAHTGIKTSVHRSATMSIGIIGFKYGKNQERMKEFWGITALGTGFKGKADPRAKLRQHLLTTAMPSGYRYTTDKKMIHPSESTRFVAHCFNAFMSPEKYKVHEVTAMELMELPVIVGTPFKGGV